MPEEIVMNHSSRNYKSGNDINSSNKKYNKSLKEITQGERTSI